jgi:FkbM family methyltransferase
MESSQMLKHVLKSIFLLTPYRVIRARDANRFQAIEECLVSLAGRGFNPRRIVDCGANVGDFARCASSIFPKATVHLVEPQPACHEILAQLARDSRFRLHTVALGAEDGYISLAIDPAGVTTGAHVRPDAKPPSDGECARVPVARLDTLFAAEIASEDRCLLKLDLQGWELEALKGAGRILDRVEVVLSEVSFFAQAYEPPIGELIRFFVERDFALYDIAALAARRRDNRAHQGDFLFVRRDSPLMTDTAWE